MTTSRKTTASLITIATTALLASGASMANLDSQFSLCAATALKEKGSSAKQINVELPSQKNSVMDHAVSSKFSEFKMELSNTKGEQLGAVSCRVNSQGQVESVRYLTKI